ncbi:MAG: NUDIX domain-containing protein [Propionibacteriales bacterium]|nr:NUDIX domain-containing protein [Propionibacteriales bacterium]
MAVSGFALVPAAYVALLRGDDVLLQRRRNTGFHDGHWAMAAAGHVEPGESCVEVASREAREELGIELDTDDLVPLCAMHRGQPGGPAIEQRVDFFFAVRTWLGEPRLAEPGKADGLEWFGLGRLPEPVVPHELVVLRALAAGTVPRMLTFGF